MPFRIERRLAAGIAGLSVAIGGFCGATPPEPRDVDSVGDFLVRGHVLLERLTGKDDDEAVRAIGAFETNYDRLVPLLLKIADMPVKSDESPFPEQRPIHAAKLLAKFRTPEAIPILVRRIDTPQLIGHELPPYGWYPYAAALASYGDDAIDPILRYLAAAQDLEVSDTAIDLYTHVLISCTRRHVPWADRAPEVIASVKRQIANTPPQQQRGLKRVLARLPVIATGQSGIMLPRSKN